MTFPQKQETREALELLVRKLSNDTPLVEVKLTLPIKVIWKRYL
jgi:hypothetical protein